MKKRALAWMLCLILFLSSCREEAQETMPQPPMWGEEGWMQGAVSDLGDDDTSFGAALEELGVYEGLFEGDSKDVAVTCLEGTEKAYRLEGDTLTFTQIGEKTAYSLTGTFRGNIVIDVGDNYKFDLELHGLSLICNAANPITVKSGDEVAIKAKKDSKNYIYDMRAAIDQADETLYSGAIHSDVDLEIGGKGALTVVSEHNNGVHSKDDLQVKNLNLFVFCVDNALKGNDGVELENANTTLIATGGDCIKTKNSDVSEKGNQRGTVSVSGGTHLLYAACDGIDAAYNVTVEGEGTVLNVFTDRYSNYSALVTDRDSEKNYICFPSDGYCYSVKYYNSEEDFVFVNAEYHSKASGGRSSYYYYSYPKMEGYAKQQFFVYEKEADRGGEEDYLIKTDYLTPNEGSDTLAFVQSRDGLSYLWTSYTTAVRQEGPGARPGGFGGAPSGPGGGGHGGGGPGGFGEGNTDKGEYSTKGIKAANEILLAGGTVSIKSYDDALHANGDQTLENGAVSTGNVTVTGGNITLYSKDDGIHADGSFSLQDGSVRIVNAYEGAEGNTVLVAGGSLAIYSKDDGINATSVQGEGVRIRGGEVYICCSGDGIDSNSRTAGEGILFEGGNTVVITNSGMNSAIDTENGYTYTEGLVVALMPRGGMSNEATHCEGFESVGKTLSASLAADSYLTVSIGDKSVTVKSPVNLNALVIVLGDSSPSLELTSPDLELDENGVLWQ